MDISNDVKQRILKDQITMWENTFFLATVNHDIGKAIQNDGMIANAVVEMKKCKVATGVLEKKLNEAAASSLDGIAVPTSPSSEVRKP